MRIQLQQPVSSDKTGEMFESKGIIREIGFPRALDSLAQQHRVGVA